AAERRETRPLRSNTMLSGSGAVTFAAASRRRAAADCSGAKRSRARRSRRSRNCTAPLHRLHSPSNSTTASDGAGASTRRWSHRRADCSSRCALATLLPAATIAALTVPPLRVHAALLLVSLLFGANYVFTKLIVAGVPVAAWVFCRIAAATVLFVLLALRFARGRLPLRLLPGLALASLLGVVLNQLLFTAGLALTTPPHSAVINSCIPTWTLVLAVLFGQERFS